MGLRLLVCLFVGLLTSECVAQDLNLRDKLGAVQSGIASIQESIRQILQQKKTVADQLADIEKRYGERAAALKALEEDIVRKRSQMESIRKDITQHQKNIALQSKALSSQLRADYMLNRPGKLKLILNRQDLVKANRMVFYYDYLSKRRLKKLALVKQSVAELSELEVLRQEEATRIERDMEKNRREQSDLEVLRNQRTLLLSQIDRDYVSDEQQLLRLKVSEKELEKLIGEQVKLESQRAAREQGPKNGLDGESDVEETKNRRAQTDFAELKGELPWPVSEIYASKGLHSLWHGILIDTPEGAEVRAVTRGKVVYAQWLSGYGLLMIIDHGKGYMTLYGFNQSLYKQVDDWVEAGEVIAGTGQSGGRSQAGLYFGIRKNGKPVDPLSWYPLLNVKKAG